VLDYGAVGDGVTNDTVAINAAIAALNAAGQGALYFPATANAYLVSSSLTTITAGAYIFGDGTQNANRVGHASRINYSANNSACFTLSTLNAKFQHLTIACTAVSTPVSGSTGILVSAFNVFQTVNYDSITVYGFYNCIDIEAGTAWSMVNCQAAEGFNYCLKIANTLNPDSGDWAIVNSVFSVGGIVPIATAVASIFIASSGGGKIANCKFNAANSGGAAPFAKDHIVIAAAAGATADFICSGCSFENYTRYGIYVNVPGTGANGYNNINIIGNQFAPLGSGAFGIAMNNASNVEIVGNSFDGIPAANIATITNSANIVAAANFGWPTGAVPGGVDHDASGGIGGSQYFAWDGSNTLTWTSSSGVLSVVATGGGGVGIIGTSNNLGNGVALQAYGSSLVDERKNKGSVSAGTTLIVGSDNQVASGGTDPISFRAGGFSATTEVFQALAAGRLAMTNTANFSGNGAVATVLGSIGPTGSHTTVQKWLTISDGTGLFYIPCF
jgi:hypothetical protein